MMRALSRCIWVGLLALCAAGIAAGAAVTGVVRNATTGAPAAHADVILLRLQGGMESVANTKTDAQGRYRLEDPGIGQQPMLIRVVYRGVFFHQPLPPGRNTADVEVYDPTTDPRALEVASRLIILQPNGATLLVGEQYTLENRTAPPKAYFKADGDFEFQVPQSGELGEVSAWGPAGMPVVQGTIPRGKDRYAIAYAFQPGQNGVRFSYRFPYSSNQASIRVVSPYAAGQVAVLAPPQLQVSIPGFQPAGTEQGYSVYSSSSSMAAGTPLEISVSGTAPPPSGDDGGADSSSGVPVQELPGRLDNLKWILIGGFAALFFLGMMMLWRRPVLASPHAEAESETVTPATAKRKGTGRKAESAAAALANSGASSLEDVHREVAGNLEALKDTLFRLEIRRQAGNISEEDYTRERSRTENRLRELVKR